MKLFINLYGDVSKAIRDRIVPTKIYISFLNITAVGLNGEVYMKTEAGYKIEFQLSKDPNILIKESDLDIQKWILYWGKIANLGF